MAINPSAGYTPYPTQESTGGLGGGIGVRASPNDFGAQVGASEKDAGTAVFDLAQKQQGMINETTMTNADTQLAIKAGEINGEYKSLTGLAAHTAFPQYQADLEAARQSVRSTLPPGAQRGFDMLSQRTIANHIIDGSSYAATQLKEANRDSYADSTNVHLQQILNPDMTDEQFKGNLDIVKFNTAAQLDADHPGLKTDPETGVVSFDEATPDGQALKAQHQQALETNVSQAYVNRYTTLAKQNVGEAYTDYLQARGEMPKAAQVALDSSFAPKILDAHKQTAASSTIIAAQQDHYEMLTNPGPKDAIDTVLKNEGGMSPDGHAIYGIDKNAHPAEFLEAKTISENSGDAAGKKYAADFYKDQYWDKNKIADLPPETQTVVMDGVVNHSKAFGDNLIQAAKDGASPQQLIDMRRAEYQRLATTNPAKYGDNLAGWNNRLDSLQQQTEGKKTYATNENGGPMSLADYYRTHSQDVYAKGDAYAESQMPGDLALKRAVRQSLQNQMTQTISNEAAQHTMDNHNVMKAINGDLTKGQPPQTEQELRALPGMSDTLDNIAARDPKFAETIPTMIAKVARQNDVTNSPNGYDTVMRTLITDPSNDNSIRSEDHLMKELGRDDGLGINMKDFKDAKPAIELDSTLKDALSKHMKDITVANGNIDGKGSDRALQWYNQTMQSWQKNAALGDKAVSPEDFAKTLTDNGAPAASSPSRMQQISHWADSIWNGKQQQSSMISVVSPDGVPGSIPASNLNKALAAGYKRAQ